MYLCISVGQHCISQGGVVRTAHINGDSLHFRGERSIFQWGIPYRQAGAGQPFFYLWIYFYFSICGYIFCTVIYFNIYIFEVRNIRNEKET